MNSPAQPKTVLYAIATLDPAGAEGQLVALATHLDPERYRPIVCALTRGGPLEADLTAAGVETVVLGKRFRLDLRVVARLARLIESSGADLVHTWLFTGNTFGRAAAWWAGTAAVIASERSVDRWRGPVHRFIDRAFARRSDRIIANAEAVKSFYVDHEGLCPELFAVVPNGLDPERFAQAQPAALRQELGLDPRARIVGCAGRLEEQKGVQHLVDAAGALPPGEAPTVFVVAGAGPQEAMLRDRVAGLGLEGRVHLLGYRSDVAEVMAACDVFVLPSLWEGLPNVVLEAMAAGVPVVATDVGGTRELVTDRESGLLAPASDPHALAHAIRQLLDDPDLAQRCAAGGRAVAERHTIAAMVERTQAVYDEVLARRAASPSV